MYRVLRPAYRPVTAAAVIGLGVVLCTTLATLTLAGGPPSWTGWRVGELAETAIPLDDAESAALQMRARTLLGELGIQTNRLTSARAFDNLRQSRVDSVTGSNAAGEPTVDVEWETGSGRLQSVTRYLRDIGPSSVELDADRIATAALAYATRARVAIPPGAPTVGWDPGMAAWEVRWERRIAGIVAPEDGLAVWVLPDGGLRGLRSTISDAAITPAPTISAPDARSAAEDFLGRADASRSVTVGEPGLEWVHPNGFVDPTLPDSPAPTLRLVYAVPFEIAEHGESVGSGVLWVDAAGGGILGGGATS